MVLNFDLLTILTTSGILAILAIYVIVVYKKGWLKKESRADQAYYLCPNQKCRRVFKKPVWLTDLSQTQPQSYQACPYCGMNVKAMSPSPPATATSQAVKSSAGAIEIRPLGDSGYLTKRERTADKPELGHESKPILQTGVSNSQRESESGQKSKLFFKLPQIRRERQQKPQESTSNSEQKGSFESQRKCTHFFGYVKTLPKNTQIPDECLWCPSIIDCLSHEKKVEAEA